MKRSLGAQTYATPAPVWTIGTYDKNGKANIMTASWAGICCSRPPCVSVALRKATQTYGNIEARRAFTVSIPSETHVKEADFFGIASGINTDKFAVSGLTPVKSELVDAPYVGEFPLVLECRLLESLVIDLHTVFIGQIMDVKADEAVLDSKGLPDLAKVKPILFNPPSSSYFLSGRFLAKGFTSAPRKEQG